MQPHRTETFTRSRAPLFIGKSAISLHLDLPDRAWHASQHVHLGDRGSRVFDDHQRDIEAVCLDEDG